MKHLGAIWTCLFVSCCIVFTTVLGLQANISIEGSAAKNVEGRSLNMTKAEFESHEAKMHKMRIALSNIKESLTTEEEKKVYEERGYEECVNNFIDVFFQSEALERETQGENRIDIISDALGDFYNCVAIKNQVATNSAKPHL